MPDSRLSCWGVSVQPEGGLLPDGSRGLPEAGDRWKSKPSGLIFKVKRDKKE